MNVYYTDTAKQQLKELERHFQKRILDKVAVYASLPNPLEFAEPLAGYDMNRFRVGDYRVAFQIDQNIISLADIRQTTNSVNPLCAVSDSSLAATAELSATPPSHPPGEWMSPDAQLQAECGDTKVSSDLGQFQLDSMEV